VPTPVPVHWCLTRYNLGEVVVNETTSTSSCGTSHLLGDVMSLGTSVDTGTLLTSMPSAYVQVCRWSPYPYTVGDSDMADGGSAWGYNAISRHWAQFWCDLKHLAPAPTPVPRCLPQSDATVQKNRG
jgi:hypothetical protein